MAPTSLSSRPAAHPPPALAPPPPRPCPQAWRYVWVERWSEEHKRPYYFNQETKQSTWTRPADLAWQR